MNQAHSPGVHPHDYRETAWILPLHECRDATLVGGKAINLGELRRAGFAVPDGFVITTNAYSSARNDQGEPSASLVSEIKEAYSRLGAGPVAVRSSATAEDLPGASMAGQYDTFLDVRDGAALLDRIHRCWMSIDSPRTQAYLKQHGLRADQVRMAVVVQRLVSATVAGVAFSADPRTGRRDHMLIEASWGLGESLVSGDVQPDTLTLSRDDGRVIEARIVEKPTMVDAHSGDRIECSDADRRKPCLTSRQVHAIWELVRRVESHFDTPQDIEWAFDADELFVLQSRPVTTLSTLVDRAALIRDIKADVGSMLDRGQGPWVPHNISETLPHPTPLTWSIIRQFLSGAGGLGMLYRMAGFQPGPRVEQDGFVDLIAGCVYMDLSRAPDMFLPDFPFAYDPEQLIGDPNAGQSPPTLAKGTLRQRVRAQHMLRLSAARLDELAKSYLPTLERNLIPTFNAWVESQQLIDLTTLSTAAFLDLWPRWHRRVMEEFAPQSLLPSLIAGHVQTNLTALLSEYLWDECPRAAVEMLSAGGPADQTLESNDALFRVATGELDLAAWIDEYGHRAPNEFDLATPRWSERPADVTRLAAQLKNGVRPGARHESQRQASAALQARLRSKLPQHDRPLFDTLVDRLQRHIPYRESGKFHLMHGYALLRKWAIEAGRRLGIDDDVMFLNEAELRDAVRSGFAPLTSIQQRRKEHASMISLQVPQWLDRTTLEAIGETPQLIAVDGALRGFPISPGVGTGAVCIAASPTDQLDVSEGYVLVCRSTDPAWTPLFINAAGLVLEVGGSLSHGAIVARELGVPAVVVPAATRLLQPGQQVRVDGDRGLVSSGDKPVSTSDAPENAPTGAVPHERRPPTPGRTERRWARIRNVAAAGWLVFVAAAFALPPAWIYEPSIAVLDAVLWPLMRTLGTAWGTAVLAGAIAVGTMLLQRLLTDHRRLSIAKQRARLLEKELKTCDSTTRRGRHIQALIRPVQYRLLGAAMVPLGLLLGPLILIFLWLPARVDPAVTPPAPGARIIVKAEIDGGWVGPVQFVSDHVRLPLGIEPTQRVRPIRDALMSLRREWIATPTDPALPWHVSAAGDITRQHLIADMDRYLSRPIPVQTVAWPAMLPDAEGMFALSIVTENHPPIDMQVASGRDTAPRPSVASNMSGPIRQVTIVYPAKRQSELIFWAPFARWGWGFDVGWLGVYLIAYVPLMIASKLALRIP